MSTIRPFRAVRPKAELAASIAALPYDVYSTAEAREVIAEEPLSFLRSTARKHSFPKTQILILILFTKKPEKFLTE